MRVITDAFGWVIRLEDESVNSPEFEERTEEIREQLKELADEALHAE